jgi:hypothetical protein
MTKSEAENQPKHLQRQKKTMDWGTMAYQSVQSKYCRTRKHKMGLPHVSGHKIHEYDW